MPSDLAIDREDLPEELQEVHDLDEVEEIVEYQTAEADFSAIMDYPAAVSAVRVHYLENLREDWEWVDSSKKGVGWVMLRRREQ